MENRKALPERVSKAKFAAKFAAVVARDKQGRAKTVLVPGSEAKRYRVIIRRYANLVTTECHCEAGSLGHVPCPGNSNGHVCYHSFQALIKASVEAGRDVSFCVTQADAERLARLGGVSVPVRSHQGHGELWAVVQ